MRRSRPCLGLLAGAVLGTATCSWRETRSAPPITCARVQQPVVYSVRRLTPELDRLWKDADGAPILGTYGRALHGRHQMGVAGPQRSDVVDLLALARNQCLHLV